MSEVNIFFSNISSFRFEECSDDKRSCFERIFGCCRRRKRKYTISTHSITESDNEEESGNSNQSGDIKLLDAAVPRRGRKRKQRALMRSRSKRNANRRVEVDSRTRKSPERGNKRSCFDGLSSCFRRRKIKDLRKYIISTHSNKELMAGEGNNEEGSGNSNQCCYVKKFEEAGPRRGRKRNRAPMRSISKRNADRRFGVNRGTRSHSKRGNSRVEQ